MRPLKSLSGLAKWFLRFALIAIVFSTSFQVFISFSFQTFSYFIHLLLVLFGVLLFMGAFAGRSSLTVLSSLFICILYFIDWYITGIGSLQNGITHLLYMSVSFYFLTHGNK